MPKIKKPTRTNVMPDWNDKDTCELMEYTIEQWYRQKMSMNDCGKLFHMSGVSWRKYANYYLENNPYAMARFKALIQIGVEYAATHSRYDDYEPKRKPKE